MLTRPRKLLFTTLCLLAFTPGYAQAHVTGLTPLHAPTALTSSHWHRAGFPDTDLRRAASQVRSAGNAQHISAADAQRYISDCGVALGMPPRVVQQVLPLLLATIRDESTFRPAIIAGEASAPLGSGTPVGLLQITPATFRAGRVPGFSVITNPAHQICAGMNIMRHATSMATGHGSMSIPGWGIWPRGGGWSPAFRSPFAHTD